MSDYEEESIDIQNSSKKIISWIIGWGCRAEFTDEWLAFSGITEKIPPFFDGSLSWFNYEELIDDWLDLTQRETGKRGPALKNILVGDAAV